MLGKPKYKYDDIVEFQILDKNDKKITLKGTIYIIDAYGTFWQNEEVSYDIMVPAQESHIGTDCLYKHIRESQIKPA